MKLFFEGRWRDTGATTEVRNPYDGSVVDTVPKATADDVAAALATLVEGAKAMRAMPAFERSEVLRRAVAGMHARAEELARTISAEEGKPLAEGRGEVERAIETMSLSADEAKRLNGESFPLDAAPNGVGKFGFTIRVPCGIVAAITPFNFPLNLVCHKVGPAIAGGNAVLVKPATDTPLSALKLVEILLEAGLPESAIACLVGSGSELGKAICTDDRVRKISFTGSDEVGRAICAMAGVKRVTMELGSNCPVIVMDDADVEAAAAAVARSGYANAGQVCISTQRVYTAGKVHGDYLDALRAKVAALVPGDQLKDGTTLGPMVRESDAKRVEEWVGEAVAGGAKLVAGGKRHGTVYEATILDDVTPEMKVSREELFGPAVAVRRFAGINEAIAFANDTRYGLAAGIFTRDLDRAMRFAREVDAGVLNVNAASQYRADLMPYGGLKQSGLGKEGPKYAVREMTEEKMVVLQLG
jgi:glyceraldehyde-3-phosphate dehydrogenase (NADP+)